MHTIKSANIAWDADFAAEAGTSREEISSSVRRLQQLNSRILAGEPSAVRIGGDWYQADDVGRYVDTASSVEKTGVRVKQGSARNWFSFSLIELVI